MNATQQVNLGRRRIAVGLAFWWAGAARAVRPPELLLAREADRGIDPAGYLVSEKYDGVRALWDGTRLRFRSGREIVAPDWFLRRLPERALDGELWLGRGRFEATAAAVRRERPHDDEWRALRYMVFELPGAAGDFAARAAAMRCLVASLGDGPIEVVEQQRVADRAALQRRFDAVLAVGGEGLMLHRADAAYATGRSDALLKLKPVQDDEAMVVGHEPGRGKYVGQLGALRVRRGDGTEFRIGTGFSDALRAEPPPPGSVVTYTHRGQTRDGVPRFASFLRLRGDL